jgi:hypothetical protein
MQPVHVFGPPELVGRVLPAKITAAGSNSLSGEIVQGQEQG